MVKTTAPSDETAPAGPPGPPPGIAYCVRTGGRGPCRHCGGKYTRICVVLSTVGVKAAQAVGPRDNGITSNRQPKPARRPTSAVPGSEAKIAEMEARFNRGEAIFHPDDLVVRQGFTGSGTLEVTRAGYELTPATDDVSHSAAEAGVEVRGAYNTVPVTQGDRRVRAARSSRRGA